MAIHCQSEQGRVFSYDRVSSTTQVSGGGLQRQNDMAAAWCKNQGVELDTELNLKDSGRSAFKGHHLTRGALGRFIAMAQAGSLGPNPTLLVEAIDRVSRLEPLDALDDLLLELVKRCGITLITLEDNQVYSRETLSEDPMALMKLAMLTQAAHQYSRRLSNRLSKHWEQVDAMQREGKKIVRGNGGRKPFWLDADIQRDEWVLNEDLAPGVARAFELLLNTGLTVTADLLNAEGFPGPKGKPWDVNSVRRLSVNPAVKGTLERFRTAHEASVRDHRKWLKAKEAAEAAGDLFNDPEPQIRQLEVIEDFYPAVVSAELWDQVRAVIDARDNCMSGDRGPKNKCLLQGMIQCEGGSSMGTTMSTYRTTGWKKFYLKCRQKRLRKPCSCNGQGWEMDGVVSNVLTRVNMHLLDEACIPGEDRRAEASRLKFKVDAAALVVADAQAAVEKAQAMFEEAMDEGSLDAVEIITGVLEKRRVAERKATAELDRLKQQQLMLDAKARPISKLKGEGASQLLSSIAKHTASESEIARLREVLQQSELRVVLKGSGSDRTVGMRFGPGDEFDWQPLAPGGRRAALMMGEANPLAATDDAVVLAGGRETGDPDRVTVVIPGDVSDDEASKIVAAAVHQMKSPEE